MIGDVKNIPEINSANLTDAWRSAGVQLGDVLNFHSSLKSLGYIQGGAPAVIAGTLKAVGPAGTVAVPTLWYNGDPKRKPENFNRATSPAYNGAVAEAMRTDPRAIRSCHFSHAVSAIGRQAAALTAGHGTGQPYPSPWGETAFAEISPWSKFFQWDAWQGFIGVDLKTCTMKHWIESQLVVSILQSYPRQLQIQLRAQLGHDCQPGPWPFFNGTAMTRELEQRQMIHYIPIGATKLFVIRTQQLVKTTLEILRSQPEKWFTTQFLTWCDQLPNRLKN